MRTTLRENLPFGLCVTKTPKFGLGTGWRRRWGVKTPTFLLTPGQPEIRGVDDKYHDSSLDLVFLSVGLRRGGGKKHTSVPPQSFMRRCLNTLVLEKKNIDFDI